MNTADLKGLKRTILCERIAVIWSAGWGIASVLLMAALWPHFASGQAIYLNHNGGTVDPDLVNEASWSIRERTGMGLDIAGTSTTACGNPITVRFASVSEWAAINKPSYAKAVTANCPVSPQKQVVLSPWDAPAVNTIRHELGHAAGCWKELSGPENAMYSQVPAEFMTVADIDCIVAGAFWPLGMADRCFVEVGATMNMYIPSIAGLEVWLTYQGNYTWAVSRSKASTLHCSGNALSGSVATFDDVRGYSLGSLTYVRIRNTTGGLWVLEAAR